MDEAQRLFEQLTQEINGALSAAETARGTTRELEAKQEAFKAQLRKYQSDREILDRDRASIDQEKAHITKLVAQREADNRSYELKLKDLENKENALEGRKVELAAIEERVTGLTRDAEDIQATMLKIKDQQAVLDREKVIDRERKGMLDMKEVALEREKERLQNIAIRLKN